MAFVGIIISLFSLLISFANLFISNFRVNHQLFLVHAGQSGMETPVNRTNYVMGSSLNENVILTNAGNRDEVLLRLALAYEAGGGRIAGSGPKPIVIKSGEAYPVTLSIDFPSLTNNLSNNGAEWSKFGVVVQPIMPDGTAPIQVFWFGKLRNSTRSEPSFKEIEYVLTNDQRQWAIISQDSAGAYLSQLWKLVFLKPSGNLSRGD